MQGIDTVALIWSMYWLLLTSHVAHRDIWSSSLVRMCRHELNLDGPPSFIYPELLDLRGRSSDL